MRCLLFSVLIVATYFNLNEGCHYGEYRASGRKKRSTSAELYDSTSLIAWFTNCMKRTSAASATDWYSNTAWTIADSNWYFRTENKYCKDSSTITIETNCWISRVESFFDVPVALTVKSCINEYKDETIRTGSAPATLAPSRKRRQAEPSTYIEPVCPAVNLSNYENGLVLQVPTNSRTKLSLNDSFDLYHVSQFIRFNTSCGNQCAVYRPKNVPASDCWPQQFSQQTRDLSDVKFPIQRVNARYAAGGDIVGACRGNFFWTKWYNDDSPYSGEGDDELLKAVLLRQRTMVCENPSGIQARVVQGDLPWGQANQNIQISPSLGLVCKNSEQTDGRCKDYRIRFCCSAAVGRCPIRYGWTPFFDHSNPDVRGDSELLPALRSNYPGRICETPLAIGAETVDGRPYQASGNRITISPSFGLQCNNIDQVNHDRCNDFKVRFCCSDVVGSCPSYTHHWSPWFDHPSSATGDDESLQRIRQSNPGVCAEPTAIQAQVSNTSDPYLTGGDRLRVEPGFGLLCENSLQYEGTTCKEYKVRFCCGPPLSTTTEPTLTTTLPLKTRVVNALLKYFQQLIDILTRFQSSVTGNP